MARSVRAKMKRSCPEPPPPPSDEEREYSLDDFDILKTVGTGTFGRVCLVRDTPTSKYFALKVLSISDVIRLKQTEHVKNEKNILKTVRHPFIIAMYWTFHDDDFLFMLFEFATGGELFSYLRNAGRFNSTTASFYAAEIVLALDYLHSQSIVYRDLKPENLLLDRDGHVKLTDFGFAKRLIDRTWTLCGTPEYLAPEIIQSKGHNRAVDWWALGILIYEMLAGYPPFYDDNAFGIYEKILSGKIDWPKHTDPVAKDLIKKLLVQERTKRLGCMKVLMNYIKNITGNTIKSIIHFSHTQRKADFCRNNGSDDIKKHRWFKAYDWDDVYNRKLAPPILPKVDYDGDTENFDEYPENDWKMRPAVSKKELAAFSDF